MPKVTELISGRMDILTPKPRHFLLHHSFLNDLKETHVMGRPQSEEAADM